jgi:hypothetical protein
MTQAGSEAAEGIQAVANELVDPDAIGSSFVLRPLQGAEQARGSRDGDRHKPKAS